MVPPHHDRDRRPALRRYAGQGRRALRREPQRRRAAAEPVVHRRHARRAASGRPAAARPEHVLGGRHLVAGRLQRQQGRSLARLPGQRRRQRLDHDPAARPRRRSRGRRRGLQGEVQRGDLAAGPLLLPLPALPHRGHRRGHRGGGAARRSADAAPRRRVPGRRRAGPGVPRQPAAEHLARALARRAGARRAHARGHVGEEPAVGAARRRPRTALPRSASRSRSSTSPTRGTPSSGWTATT